MAGSLAAGIVWAFDFDGVLCDSAMETAHTALRVCRAQWGSIPNPAGSAGLLQSFRSARSILETGWEAILMLYLLLQGLEVAELVEEFHVRLKASTMAALGTSEAQLKALFQEARDDWVAADAADWVATHGFFETALASVQVLLKRCEPVYIISTKAAPFVARLLESRGVEFPGERIFGLGSGPKPAVVHRILQAHVGSHLFFLEDRVQTLELFYNEVWARDDVRLGLATWGYNTVAERERARASGRILVLDTQQDLATLVEQQHAWQPSTATAMT